MFFFKIKIMKILIVYGTIEGQTRKIARFMNDVLQEAGHKVTIADASDEPPSPDGYDAVLIGGSIHAHNYQTSITHYIKQNVNALNKIPGAFFSVCLAVASDREEEHREAEKIAADFIEQTGWHPLRITQFAGALKYSKYDFFKRMVMKMIAKKEGHITDPSQDYEYTNWNEVKSFVIDFTENVAQSTNTSIKTEKQYQGL